MQDQLIWKRVNFHFKGGLRRNRRIEDDGELEAILDVDLLTHLILTALTMSFLPFTTLQATYPEVFNDVSTSLLESDAVWLSIYQGNAPNASIHSKLTLTACKEDPSDPNTDSGVKIEKLQVKGTERLKVDRLGKSRVSILSNECLRRLAALKCSQLLA